jgi:hypothetical protein
VKQVLFNNVVCDVLSEEKRAPINGIKLLGTILTIRSTVTGEVDRVYPWDVWGYEEWERLDGTCDLTKLPKYLD